MNVLLIGATSRILEEVARLHASRRDGLFLVGRDEAKLKSIAADLGVRGASGVSDLVCDLNGEDSHQKIISWLRSGGYRIDRVYMGQGVLIDQSRIESDLTLARVNTLANFESYVRVGIALGGLLAENGGGKIVILGSVAGLRGKQSNLAYAAALAGRNTFADGLRHRLIGRGVYVYTALLGFVDTPMTSEFKKGLLWISAAKAARSIVRLADGRRFKVYIPGFWRWIFCVIRSIPERIFLRTKL